MYLNNSKTSFNDLKLKLFDEYKYRNNLNGVKDKKLESVYRQLEQLAG